MPNHISHIMTVDGHAEDVAAFLHVLRSEPQDEENGADAPDGNHYHLDFNKFIPRPPALDVESGSSSHWDMHFFRNPSECITDTDSFVARTAPVAAAALLEHGNKTNAEIAEILQQEVLPEWLVKATDFHRLNDLVTTGRTCLDNINRYGHPTWYEWSVECWGTKWNSYDNRFEVVEPTHLTMRFQTAWSPPTPVLEEIARQHPNLAIRIDYIDEGYGFAGTYTLSGGQIEDSPVSDGQVASFASDVFGWQTEDEDEDEDTGI